MKKNICVLGMGYVGLTLSGVCLEKNHSVIGVDINHGIVNSVNSGKAHFYEPGLNEILVKAIKEKRLHCILPEQHAMLSKTDIFIVTVGTPLIEDSDKPNLNYIKSAIDTISPYLNKDKLLILRSTVVVGLTNKMLIPHILEITNLKEEDLNICFAPERTVEGDALNELVNLPQIIGYNNIKAKDLAVEFFNTFVKEYVLFPDLEGAELIKLFNNVYRDLNFAIGNVFNKIAKSFDLNGFEIISKANYNYKRSNIPSPGFVAGPCLEKDSYILCNNLKDSVLVDFVLKGRRFNKSLEDDFVNWVSENFDFNNKILITGMAFKGRPETGDLRGSSSVNIYLNLVEKGFSNIYIHDFVSTKKELESISPGNVIDDLFLQTNNYDLIAILNNHKSYESNNFNRYLNDSKSIIFDAWNITKIKNIKNLGNI